MMMMTRRKIIKREGRLRTCKLEGPINRHDRITRKIRDGLRHVDAH
jgi:hypothetical protein